MTPYFSRLLFLQRSDCYFARKAGLLIYDVARRLRIDPGVEPDLMTLHLGEPENYYRLFPRERIAAGDACFTRAIDTMRGSTIREAIAIVESLSGASIDAEDLAPLSDDEWWSTLCELLFGHGRVWIGYHGVFIKRFLMSSLTKRDCVRFGYQRPDGIVMTEGLCTFEDLDAHEIAARRERLNETLVRLGPPDYGVRESATSIGRPSR